jgi:hypothetical protein
MAFLLFTALDASGGAFLSRRGSGFSNFSWMDDHVKGVMIPLNFQFDFEKTKLFTREY